MVEEPIEKPSTEEFGFLRHENPDDSAGGPQQPRVVPIKSSIFGRVFVSGTLLLSPFIQWFFAGKGRTAIFTGVSASLIVAIGFWLFDARRDEWTLKQRYQYATNSYERRLLFARDLVAGNEYAEAEPILRKLIEKQGGTSPHADALLLFAECVEHSVSDKEARKIYERFISEYPTDSRVPSAHVRIGGGLARNGLFDESNQMYEKALRMVDDPAKKADIGFFIADNLFNEGNLKGAVRASEEILQQYPDTVAARDSALLLARALKESERFEEAERVLRDVAEASQSKPHSAAALHMLAQNALASDSYEEAITYCNQWLEVSPLSKHQVDVMLILGNAHLKAGRPDKALKVASDIATFFPDSGSLAQAQILRGKSLEAKGKADEAETSYLEAADYAASEPAPQRQLAQLYVSQGKLSEAVKRMKFATELAPDEDSFLMELAKLYRLNGENVSAEEVLLEFTRERQLSPFIGEAFLLLADIQTEDGRLHDAYETVGRLLGVGTTTVKNHVIYEKQGDILARAGMFDDAVESFRLSLESGASPVAVRVKMAEAFLADNKPRRCLDKLDSVTKPDISLEESFAVKELKARAFLALGMPAESRRLINEAIMMRTDQEKFSTLALLMQANLALEDGLAASKVFHVTLKLIEDLEEEAPPEARRIVLQWARYLYERLRYDEAAEAYSRVLAPQFPHAEIAWATFQEGNCYYHMNDHQRAREIYARLRSDYYDSEWVRIAEQRTVLMELATGT